MQVKGLTAEHGRFNQPSSQTHPPPSSPHHEPPVTRRQSHQQRSSLASLDSYAKSVKRETDMIMHSSPASLSSYPSYMPPYLPQMNFEPPRKRHLKSPFQEQDSPRGSVLRDGSKAGLSSPSPVGKGGYGAGSNRPSSVSSNAPTEADTQQMERNSPQQSK